MKQKKSRINIPKERAAHVLFLADRICCVCRNRGKPVQIHHIDEDPSNNELKNLSVLCFDCHRETMISGGFDRKLDGEQVILYRDDWLKMVAENRVSENSSHALLEKNSEYKLEWATSLAEIYRENGDNEALAIHYNRVGNNELRDKYIERTLQEFPTDATIIYLRGLQSKPKLIPEDVVARQIEWATRNEDWSRRARINSKLGNHIEAAKDYVKQVSKALDDGSIFNAAFYLQELVEKGLIQELFIEALKNAQKNQDLWWQIRAMQELGWQRECDQLILDHSEEILTSHDPMFLRLLASAKGDSRESLELDKKYAQETRLSD
jgi:hypothetical protein